MRLNILIGGQAGQGINKVSEVVANVLAKEGYFVFNYRDYPSLIRGGHNFNILSISDKRVGSIESKLDGIIALDENTGAKHKKELGKEGFVVKFSDFKDLGRNLNIAMAGALIKILGFDEKVLLDEVGEELGKDAVEAAKLGYSEQEKKFDLKKLKNKVGIISGTEAVAKGFENSGGDFYFAYPMTPATGVLHVLGSSQNGHEVFQPENEIAVVNMALGCSFAGKKIMVGTSGGGFDLMTEALSMQGQTEIPLVMYLASRPGPGTGVPTYSMQCDLNVALKSGHGEFPRVVIAPGDPIECEEKTNEAMYLSEKFGCASIVLSDKHLAESQFSSDRKPNKVLKVDVKRKVPGKDVVRANSYEHDENGHTSEEPEVALKGAERRLKRYEDIKKEVKKFEMIKIFGNKSSKKVVVGWGSTKTAILDAIDGSDWKFLQVLYLKPMSDEIKKILEQAEKIVLVENNVTGQLGRLIREKTGIKIENRILKYDSRPFCSDELKKEIGRFE